MAKYDFVAVDVETASKGYDSCCAIGIVAVKEGTVVDTFYSLVNYAGTFSPGNVRVNGITKQDVATAPSANMVWEQIERFFSPHWPVVGHNIKSFDSKVLDGSFSIDTSKLWLVDTLHLCRLRLSIKPMTLDNCAAFFHIDMGQHHNAMDDAMTAAKIMLAFCKLNGYIELTEMMAREPLFFGRPANSYYEKLPEQLPDEMAKIIENASLHSEIADTTCKKVPQKQTESAGALASAALEQTDAASAKAATPVIPAATEIDKSNPLFGKVIVFTGYAPNNPTRARELTQIAIDHGAEVKRDVSRKVNIVVCARVNDPEGARTGKHQKAIDLNNSGVDICIISEDEFLNLVSGKQDLEEKQNADLSKSSENIAQSYPKSTGNEDVSGIGIIECPAVSQTDIRTPVESASVHIEQPASKIPAPISQPTESSDILPVKVPDLDVVPPAKNSTGKGFFTRVFQKMSKQNNQNNE